VPSTAKDFSAARESIGKPPGLDQALRQYDSAEQRFRTGHSPPAELTDARSQLEDIAAHAPHLLAIMSIGDL
jgi:hypothetical protein